MKENYCYHLTKSAFEQRWLAIARNNPRMPASMIDHRLEAQAAREWNHNVEHQKRARAARRRRKAHQRASLQAKDWKSQYDAARRAGERFVHAEAAAHPLLRALKGQITFA